MRRRKLFAFMASMCLALPGMIIMASEQASAGASYYVATNGSDANAGTRSAPFATITKARDALRTAGGGTVYLRGGTYNVTSPITFDNRDSDATYRAYKNEKVLVSGGSKISGPWTNAGSMGGGVHWSVPVPNAASWNFRELWVDNDRMTRSRWPNDPRAEGDLGQASTNPFLTMTGYNTDRSQITLAETIPVENLSGLGAEFVIHAVWSEFRNIVTSSNAHTLNFAPKPGGMAVGLDSIYLRVQDEKVSFNGKKFWPYNSYLENAYAFMDTAKEWYLDKNAGVLHIVLPNGQDPNSANVVAPVTEKLIVVQGAGNDDHVKDLHFSGIDFGFTEWKLPASGYNEQQATHWAEDGTLANDNWAVFSMSHALQFTNARDVSLENVKVAHTGGGGVAFGAGTDDTSLSGSEIFDTGGTAVSVGWWGDAAKHSPGEEWDNAGDVPTDNVVTQNYIHDVGRMYVGGVGIWVGFTDGTKLTHNEIARGNYTGISAGWNWRDNPTSMKNLRIDANDIHHVMRTLTDGGGIYVLGNQPGARMVGNHLHDIYMDHYAKGWLANGLYFDQGSKGPWSVKRNVMASVPFIPLHFNSGLGVDMSAATWGTNYFDDRYTPTAEYGGPTYVPGQTFNVSNPPDTVASIIKDAGPDKSYRYLYSADDPLVHSGG